MRSGLLLSALLALGACKDEAKKEDKKAADGEQAKDKADAKKSGTKTAENKKAGGEKDEGKGPGLGSAVAEAVGGTANAAALKLVPDAAVAVGGIDLAGVLKTPLWTAAKDKMDPNVKDVLDVAESCKVGPDVWKGITFGIDFATESSTFIVEATGVGKPENLECIRAAAEKKDGKSPWKAEEDGKKLVGPDAIGRAIDDNMVAFSTKAWADAVDKRIAGEGAGAADSKLKGVLAKASQGKHIWLAGVFPKEIATMAGGTLGSPPSDGTAWIDLSAGLAGHIAIGVEDSKAAKAAVDKQWASAKGMAGAVGVPQPVVDSVKIGATDKELTVDFKATTADLEAMAKNAAGALGGP